MNRAYVVSIFAGIVLGSSPAVAQLGLVEQISLSGDARQLAVEDGVAAVRTSSNQVTIVDATEPGTVSSIVTMHLGSSIGPLTISDSRVVVGKQRWSWWSGDDELRVLDVTDPASPYATHHRDLYDRPWALAANDQFLVVGTQQQGFQIFEFNGPHVYGPLFQEQNTGGRIEDIENQGDLFYVLSSSRLMIYEVSDPTTVIPLSSIGLPGNPRRISVRGNRAAVLNADNSVSFISIVDPQTPWVFASYDGLSNASDIVLLDRHAIAATDSGLQVISTVNPLAPELWEVFSLFDIPRRLALDGQMVYATAGNAGLFTVDASAYFAEPEPYDGPVYDLRVRDGIGYVAAGEEGLAVLDMSDPANPLLTSALALGGTARAVELQGDFAFLALGNAGLQVVYIADPMLPVPVATLDTNGRAIEIAIDNGLLALADEGAGIDLYDISSPSAPFLASEILSDIGWDVAFTNGYLLTTEGGQGVAVYDVSVPSGPMELDRVALDRWAYQVEVIGDTVYVTDVYGGLHVFTLSDVGTLAPIGQIGGVGFRELTVSDADLFVTEKSRLYRYDTRAPFRPVFRYVQTAGGFIYGTLVVNDQLFLALGPDGMERVSLDQPPCLFDDLTLSFTYVSEPTEARPHRYPWTDEEIAFLQALFGIDEGPEGQQCLGYGLFDRIQRLIGPPDPVIGEDGIERFQINVQKRTRIGMGSIAAFYDGENIVLLIDPGDPIEDKHLGSLAHELTHAIDGSLEAYHMLLGEGVPVAIEILVAEQLLLSTKWRPWLRSCHDLDLPGIAQYRGSGWNQMINLERYVGSGCFWLQQYHAALAEGNEFFFRDLRDLTTAAPDPGDPEVDTIRQAIIDAAPACIEGRAREDWLGSRHIFDTEQPLPSLEVYLGPEGTGLGSGRLGKILFYKRHLESDRYREVVPEIDLFDEMDMTDFYDAEVDGGWTLYDYEGNIVGDLVREYGFNTLGLGGPRYWAKITEIPVEDELPPCPGDTDGDGYTRCKSSQLAWLTVTYSDPLTGDETVVEHEWETYRFHGYAGGDILGVTRDFVTGKVRVSLLEAGIQYDALVEGGAFGSSPNGALIPEAEQVCPLSAEPRFACPTEEAGFYTQKEVEMIKLHCQEFTRITPSSLTIRHYRGPVRVERIERIDGLNYLVEPKYYTKMIDRLDVVY